MACFTQSATTKDISAIESPDLALSQRAPSRYNPWMYTPSSGAVLDVSEGITWRERCTFVMVSLPDNCLIRETFAQFSECIQGNSTI